MQRFAKSEANLDKEVQRWTARRFAETEEDASGAIRSAYATIAFLLAGALATVAACNDRRRAVEGDCIPIIAMTANAMHGGYES